MVHVKVFKIPLTQKNTFLTLNVYFIMSTLARPDTSYTQGQRQSFTFHQKLPSLKGFKEYLHSVKRLSSPSVGHIPDRVWDGI